jgi:pimeloyl-ACP methyl ester carboxylesterase
MMTTIGNGAPPPHFIVFVPGYMGSRLRSRSTGKLVWIDVQDLLSDPPSLPERLQSMFDQLRYPNDDLVPDGVVDQVMLLPPLFKQEEYGRMLEVLQEWGYAVSDRSTHALQPTVYTFAYDWRQDNRLSARLLGEAIQGWKALNPEAEVWIIAHSNGGMVARWYIQKEGGKEVVNRLFLLASPWDGAPRALQVLLDGFDIFLLRMFDRLGVKQMVHDAALTFPSFYELLPARLPFLKNRLGQLVDLYKDPHWLETDAQRALLGSGRSFTLDLGVELGVETLNFFGVKQPTTSGGTVLLDPQGKIAAIHWEQSEDGDGVVPVHSARHLLAEQNLPYAAAHGELYIYPPLLDKLRYELIDRYGYGPAAREEPARFKAMLQTDRDAYQPGETILVRAGLFELADQKPVGDAAIQVRLAFRDSLIPSASTPPGRRLSRLSKSTPLQPDAGSPGLYQAGIAAPLLPGFYQLKVNFHPPQAEPFEVTDLILVEPERWFPLSGA